MALLPAAKEKRVIACELDVDSKLPCDIAIDPSHEFSQSVTVGHNVDRRPRNRSAYSVDGGKERIVGASWNTI